LNEPTPKTPASARKRRHGRTERESRLRALPEILEELRLPGFEERGILCRLEAEWESLVGKTLSSQSIVYDYQDRVLVVFTASPAVSQRLAMMRGGLMRKIAARYGLPVADIKVMLGARPRPRFPRASSPRPRARRLPNPAEVETLHEEIASRIDDPSISRPLASLLALLGARGPKT
jgi:hypothetical protein